MASANLVVSLLVGGLSASVTALVLTVVLLASWIVGLGTLVRAWALRVSVQLGGVDRIRLARLGVRIDPPALPEPPPGASFMERQVAWSRARWLWRFPAYQLVRLPLAATMAFVAVGWWWATVVAFVLAGGPGGSVLLIAWPVGPRGPGAAGTFGLVAAGLVGMGAWPALARLSVEVDAAVARAFLGRSRAGRLAAEVSRLNAARTLAVESAEAERRRIERDLHDGLQAQLVSLALDLGLARSRFERDPAAARSMVHRAHEEAKRAAADLRNLVRGIHPAVLDERGLDAALSALVAGCPVPVVIDARLPDAIDRTREAITYYVVAEAVTNITKHSGARRASVVIDSEGSSLRVVVEDDGRGGARLEPGGGLSGLAARVASVDGSLTVVSPAGGPTRIEAVIPCAS